MRGGAATILTLLAVLSTLTWAHADSVVIRDAEGRRVDRFETRADGSHRVILRDGQGRRVDRLDPVRDRPDIVRRRDAQGRPAETILKPSP